MLEHMNTKLIATSAKLEMNLHKKMAVVKQYSQYWEVRVITQKLFYTKPMCVLYAACLIALFLAGVFWLKQPAAAKNPERGEVTLLARVIEGEAANEPFLGKVAVGAVILNRTKSADFPHTISGVIYQDHAFESVANGQVNRPLSQESIRAADTAMGGYDPTGGSLFFWNPSKPVSPWIWSRNINTEIGNHVFGR
ncbi:cell wall hydrolase [Propionispora sp. 2/2-37]|uniref:cell wall hydrolase n=1 Tax=Propionispora sp. 2/2-37 TaxID=1677858 RepID=UPI001C1034BD|nr:cell wall hydrolase [Propionispora sp. 2/2-37]